MRIYRKAESASGTTPVCILSRNMLSLMLYALIDANLRLSSFLYPVNHYIDSKPCFQPTSTKLRQNKHTNPTSRTYAIQKTRSSAVDREYQQPKHAIRSNRTAMDDTAASGITICSCTLSDLLSGCFVGCRYEVEGTIWYVDVEIK